MSQTLEIEFKNMLTKVEYEMLLKEFKITEQQIFQQRNHYFDTSDFVLKKLGTALRIRQKNNTFELTLKQPASIGLLETNQVISEEQALDAFLSNKIPSGEIKNWIEANKINVKEMKYFGELLTRRVEFTYDEGLLVLDHSIYLNKEDFELEYEVQDFEKGKLIFTNLLKHYQIPVRSTENKIKRFYNQKYAQK